MKFFGWLLLTIVLLAVASVMVIMVRGMISQVQIRAEHDAKVRSGYVDPIERFQFSADPDNGCQYIDNGRSVTPRLGPDGKQMGCNHGN